ncbi:uncharacterized protein LOC6567698 [Drosophila grimshawi]|uniref:GH24876 n=1 Tax=Drosophila grimshawi TaxID=7222 RepID=B4JTD7_DROGR|nr:uncharacterized protein LOC6567698 [Drosophila grimshawi]EDV95027.1 GH24876 [Drosophila grimshawi]
MRLLLWACALCLVCNNTSGMFGASNDDFIGDAISGLNDYFVEDAATSTSKPNKPVATAETTTATPGIFDEMETSLEHATDKLDGLWQRFRKELRRMMGSISGSNDADGQSATTKVTATGNLQSQKPIVNEMLAKTSSTTAMPTTMITSTTTTLPAIELEITSTTPLP